MSRMKKKLRKMAITGVCAVAAVGISAVSLPCIGFTSSGVAAGSLAAAIQSSIGNVAAGSIFASLQSIGAGGIALFSNAALIAPSVAIIAHEAISYITPTKKKQAQWTTNWKQMSKDEDEENVKAEENAELEANRSKVEGDKSKKEAEVTKKPEEHITEEIRNVQKSYDTKECEEVKVEESDEKKNENMKMEDRKNSDQDRERSKNEEVLEWDSKGVGTDVQNFKRKEDTNRPLKEPKRKFIISKI